MSTCPFDDEKFFNHDDEEEGSSFGDDASDCYFSSDDEDDAAIESIFEEPSSVVSKSRKFQPKSSDQSMKLSAMATSIVEFAELQCPGSCQFTRSCLDDAKLSMCKNFRDFMWNPILESAPASSERRERITRILLKAFEVPTKSKKFPFSFFLEDPTVTVRRRTEEKLPAKRKQICEWSYVALLGLTETMEKPTMWRTIRADIAKGADPRQPRAVKGKYRSSLFSSLSNMLFCI